MLIKLNDEEIKIANPCSLGELLKEAGIDINKVVVEVNEEPVDAKSLNEYRVADGDIIHTAYWMAGGKKTYVIDCSIETYMDFLSAKK